MDSPNSRVLSEKEVIDLLRKRVCDLEERLRATTEMLRDERIINAKLMRKLGLLPSNLSVLGMFQKGNLQSENKPSG
jgi:GTP cyclohydrolase II